MSSKKLSLLGILLSLSLILSYVEMSLPIKFGIPGVKLGLPNIVTVIGLFSIGEKETFLIGLSRVILVSILFGNFQSLSFSLAGFVLSFLVSLSLKRLSFSIREISISGAISHNLGQIIMAAILMGTREILYYFPVIFISGLIAGLFTGILSGILLERLKGSIWEEM